MALSTVVDYWCSHAIASSDDTFRRRSLLTISIVTNLTILGFFKYAGFFVDSWIALAASQGIELQSRTWNIILPVGISFYTFQTMSYSWDVYRNEIKPLRRFTDFALYVAFFPQLVAGPIERGRSLSPQIESGPTTDLAGVQLGGWMILKGLFKKAVIADNLAPVVETCFSEPSPSTIQVLVGVYAFAFQIYGDFSGYTDIARGVGRMLGYDLSLNFRLPYLSTNPERVLAVLAHQSLVLATRLPLYPARWESPRPVKNVSQPDGNDAAGRALARRRMDFRTLGRISWPAIDHSPSRDPRCAIERALGADFLSDSTFHDVSPDVCRLDDLPR